MRNYLLNRIDAASSFERLLAFPSYFEIETVNACNASCPMCTIDDWKRRDGLMSDELFEKIADEISEHTVKRVSLYRDGEPLIDKKLPKRVGMMKDRGVKRVGISTNVSLLTRSKSEALLAAGLDEIILSVDSLRHDVYEAIRRDLKFEEVMENSIAFIEERDRMKSHCQVWVRMIRQESNRDEWPQFEAFWRSRLSDNDRVDYRNLHNWGSQLINFKPIAHADVEKPCVALWSLMVIFANGDVPRCNVDYNLKHPIGSVANSTISELWQGKIQNDVRASHLKGERDSICKGCTVWSEEANSDERMAA